MQGHKLKPATILSQEGANVLSYKSADNATVWPAKEARNQTHTSKLQHQNPSTEMCPALHAFGNSAALTCLAVLTVLLLLMLPMRSL